MKDKVKPVKRRHKEKRAYNIEVKMNDGGSLCIFVRSDTGNKRRRAGSYILTEDYRDRRSVGNATGYGKRL